VIHHIPNVLSAAQVREFRARLDGADWVDGKATAGPLAASAKKNQQLSETLPLTHELSEQIIAAVWNHPLVISAALPQQIIPPLFSRYQADDEFDFHVDNSIRLIRGTRQRLRTDISCTLFLSEPDEYEGGELSIEDTYGFHDVKLPAGDLVLYPSASLHKVQPITRGMRLVSFFWMQSMVREDNQRHMLFSLDETIQSLRVRHGDASPEVLRLTSLYHNLMRLWAEVA